MSEVSKRFEQIIKSTQKRLFQQGALMPVKTTDGILVGSAKITCEGTFKNVSVKDQIVYEKIALNEAAIKIANIIACGKSLSEADRIYRLDQQYHKHFADCAFYLDKYRIACDQQDEFKADLFWIRYQEAKYNSEYYKDRVNRLSPF
jgi:hypothetical protein